VKLKTALCRVIWDSLLVHRGCWLSQKDVRKKPCRPSQMVLLLLKFNIVTEVKSMMYFILIKQNTVT